MERAAEGWGAPAQVFARLRGLWAFERRIDDAPPNRGEARFVDAGDRRLTYRELGAAPGGGPFAALAGRALVFDLMPRGFAVSFAEPLPRIFHVVNLANVSGVVSGDAAGDIAAEQWQCRYDFRPGGGFDVAYVVRGPRGAGRMETRYRRIASPASGANRS